MEQNGSRVVVAGCSTMTEENAITWDKRSKLCLVVLVAGKAFDLLFWFWIWIGFFAEKENHQTDIEYNHKMAYTKRLACKHWQYSRGGSLLGFFVINLLSLKDFRAWFLSNLRRVQFSVPGQVGMRWANVELKVA